jgi:hypothetical protein
MNSILPLLAAWRHQLSSLCKYDENDSSNQNRYTNDKFHHSDAFCILFIFSPCFEISFKTIDEIILFPEVYKIPEQSKSQSQQNGHYLQYQHNLPPTSNSATQLIDIYLGNSTFTPFTGDALG